MNKKRLAIFALIFLSVKIFADGIPGIFGIPFGTNAAEVTTKMTEKGWTLSSTNDDELLFKKNGGTFAKQQVDGVSFSFFNDKFYDVKVVLPPVTEPSEIKDSANSLYELLKSIQGIYDLIYDNLNEEDEDGYTFYTIKLHDIYNNIFSAIVIVSDTAIFRIISMTNYELLCEKITSNEKAEQESISSDL